MAQTKDDIVITDCGVDKRRVGPDETFRASVSVADTASSGAADFTLGCYAEGVRVGGRSIALFGNSTATVSTDVVGRDLPARENEIEWEVESVSVR